MQSLKAIAYTYKDILILVIYDVIQLGGRPMEMLTLAKKCKLEQKLFCTNMFKRCCFIILRSFKVIALYYRKLLGEGVRKVPPPLHEKYGPKYPMRNRVNM
jgi:hypothetical protein